MTNLSENNLKNLKNLPLKTRNLFTALSKNSFIKNFYLAGGTALVLEFRHRISKDLDFFSEKKFNNNFIKKEIKEKEQWEASVEIENTLIGYLDGIKSSFFYLPYKLIEKPRYFNNLRVASLTDIALMKILAISQRAAKRDFVDLYVLSNEFMPLIDLIKLFPKKFGKFDYNIHHIIKSLVYFEEADRDKMPRMLINLDWPTTKQFFLKERENLLQLLIS